MRRLFYLLFPLCAAIASAQEPAESLLLLPPPTAHTNFFVQSESLSTTLRNDFTAHLGFWFQVSNQNVVVTSLGRWVYAGDGESHTLKIFTNRLDTTIGELTNVTINLAGATTNQFAYVDLPTPYTLLAGGYYFIGSSEINGGAHDRWGENDTTITHLTIAIVRGSGYTTDGLAIGSAESLDHTYGPLDFKLSSP